MLMHTTNVTIVVVYYSVMWQYNPGYYWDHALHAVPVVTSMIDFCLNRILYELNQWWISFVWFLIYGFIILWPTTTYYYDIYGPINFKTLEGVLIIAGLGVILLFNYF